MKIYDVAVVGAGHAGCEAALAAARAGAAVILITINCDHIAQMSCNPAIGGIAKGQLVREIDALGGAMGIVAEAATIQFRILNYSKGPAVWSPRAQCDKVAYQRGMKYLLEQTPNIDILQGEVTGFILKNGEITGITTALDDEIYTRTVVLTTGTFLRGLLHYGMRSQPGGRAGDFPANVLSEAIEQQLGLEIGRLKTGTPPRILRKSINFSNMEVQPSSLDIEEFSFWSMGNRPSLINASRRDLPCYQLHSTDLTAKIVHENLHLSPMYSGVIKGVGTRYCPSFEDKIVRFPQHPHHLLFLEPEGADTDEFYLNGFSSSLPPAVQKQMVHSLPGLEEAIITRYAYAIEYDFIRQHQTERTMRNKRYCNLFTAGQINGTSGYEEAAAQGLAAGLNAARTAAGLEPISFSRSQGYIGVMLDDLATKEIVEPYRLFTSRAEYRLTLRQDNADLRLSEFAHKCGLLPETKYQEFLCYKKTIENLRNYCCNQRYNGKTLMAILSEYSPNTPITVPHPFDFPPLANDRIGRRAWRELLVEARYAGYLQREIVEINRMKQLETANIPKDFDYINLPGLSNEAQQKLIKIRPETLGQAGRIDGVTPAEIALLQVKLKALRSNKL